ncbi:helix-turn-helix transcriptional regulator [Dickeya dadantii]|uniref:helix-turn-helix transcriptional regulator n=1 Tax=Dickeya dadantii TaxID=204038 RepID=UPI001C0D8E50|nr:AlpA family phage regulatory protein [Dickeya dadantii]QWT39184.1 AlpA family phage regulatory protein [Dickeya dadantii]
MSTIDIHNDKFVDMIFITNFTGMTDKWFYKLMQEEKFPHPIKFGRSSRWLESEVTAWFEEQLVKSRR